MIASWIAKRSVRSSWDLMGEDDYDVEAVVAGFAEDAVWDSTSELGVGETLSGKKAITDWFRRWKKEIPRRKFVVKNVCLKGTFLPSPNNVVMVEWGCVETDREGREVRYDGVTVVELKNMKTVRATEYISFKGLPKLSTLIRPTGKA
jgi:ketosteroid isomerase-like protein